MSRSRVFIEDIAKHEGQRVTLHGWLHNRRSSGKIHFLIVRDGSSFRPRTGVRHWDVGPGLAAVGPTLTYAPLPGAAKLILVLLMIVGRLELYTVLVLLYVGRRRF